jgi:hypothetical protein
MLDDLAAAIYANIVLQVIVRIISVGFGNGGL